MPADPLSIDDITADPMRSTIVIEFSAPAGDDVKTRLEAASQAAHDAAKAAADDQGLGLSFDASLTMGVAYPPPTS